MPIIFEGVSFSYDGAHDALTDIDLAVPDGAFMGVVGHTGSGKSTLAQLMNALLIPTRGAVCVNGVDTADRHARRQIRMQVGLVFQYPERQLFASTVADDLAFGPRNLGLADAEVDCRCRKALSRVGLDYDEVAARSPFDLSGGQRRRVALAGVLAMEPQVLVLDEPAAGMDPRAAADIRRHLRSLNADGMTIVLVSHSMEEIAALCDSVAVMDGGRIILQGTPAQVFAANNAHELATCGLGLPHAAEFAIELAARGLDLPQPVLTTDGLADALAAALERSAERNA